VKTRLVLPMLLAAALCVAIPVQAQDYPSRPIKVVVPFPPGALTDLLARMVSGKLQARWGQPVIVENRAGAAGSIGSEFVFRAEPDGHTLLFTPHSPLITSKMLNARQSFDPEAFVPVAVVTRSTVLLLVNPKVAAENLPQLIARAKASPGRLNYASPGIGSTTHLTNELFNMMAGVQITHVPYQGIGPAMTALLSGEVDMLFDAMGNALPHVRSGKARVLAVATEKRSPVVPEVPTVAEALPGFLSTLWTGMAAPPKTPAAIAGRLSAAIAAALQEPDVVKRLGELNGVEAIGSTPEEMARLMKEERERWGNVIRATGAKTE
jgi:tripartite-type tricarboxylate transporter receptor subunit TctC